jgi:hypothetical protein
MYPLGCSAMELQPQMGLRPRSTGKFQPPPRFKTVGVLPSIAPQGELPSPRHCPISPAGRGGGQRAPVGEQPFPSAGASRPPSGAATAVGVAGSAVLGIARGIKGSVVLVSFGGAIGGVGTDEGAGSSATAMAKTARPESGKKTKRRPALKPRLAPANPTFIRRPVPKSVSSLPAAALTQRLPASSATQRSAIPTAG